MASDSLETLHDLFVHELRDLYDAENQLLKALPIMVGAAGSPELKQAFQTHLRETKQQVRRLEQVFKGLGEKPSGKSCKAMKGLVEEGRELLEEDIDPEVLDAALIVAAQKIEHYEIASYGSVCTFGRVLGYHDATEILKQTMAEEERTDKLLSGIAEKLNPKAESTDSWEGEGQGDENRGGGTPGGGGSRMRSMSGAQSVGRVGRGESRRSVVRGVAGGRKRGMKAGTSLRSTVSSRR